MCSVWLFLVLIHSCYCVTTGVTYDAFFFRHISRYAQQKKKPNDLNTYTTSGTQCNVFF